MVVRPDLPVGRVWPRHPHEIRVSLVDCDGLGVGADENSDENRYHNQSKREGNGEARSIEFRQHPVTSLHESRLGNWTRAE